jgi:predicted ester cyclase
MREGHQLVIEDMSLAADKWIHPDYIHHDPLLRETQGVASRDEYLTAWGAFKEAMPDMRSSADEIIVEGNRSAARWTFSGTHSGSFNGLEPTGSRVEFSGMTLYHWKDGRIIEGWTLFDVLGFQAQIGLASAV